MTTQHVIATYNELRVGNQRCLTLFEDHVTVEVSNPNGVREIVSTPLAPLRPEYFTRSLRDPFFVAALKIMIFGVVITTVSLLLASSIPKALRSILLGVGLMGLMYGAVNCKRTLRKLEVVTFISDDRKTVLDIVKNSSDSGEFNAFVALLSVAISRNIKMEPEK